MDYTHAKYTKANSLIYSKNAKVKMVKKYFKNIFFFQSLVRSGIYYYK